MMTFPDFKYKQIIVHQANGVGEKLRFRADNIVIEDEDGHVILQHSCHRIFALLIIGEMSLTSVIIKRCKRFGFPILLLSHNMRPVAQIRSEAEGNTLLRKMQYSASDQDNLEIAKELIKIKISNQARLIKNLRYLSEEDQEALATISAKNVVKATTTVELMGIEGTASRVFFAAYFRTLGWNRREPRCKRDTTNLLLDIGYTLLFNFISAMLSLYGFDLYCGVHHKFFYQRMSLVCDIVEPFRCIIDRRIRKAHNLGQIHQEDFFLHNGRLNLEWKKQTHYVKLFLKDILAEKEQIFKFVQGYYRWVIKKLPASQFPQYQIGE